MADRQSLCESFYLVTTLLGLLTGIGFAVYALVLDHFQTSDTSYVFVFIVNSLFALVYAIKGIKTSNPYDLGIIVLSVAPLAMYVIVNFCVTHRTDVKEARLIVAIVFAVFIAGMGCYHLLGFCKTKKFMEHYGINTDEEEELKSHLRTMLLFYFLVRVNLQIDLSASVFTLTSGYAINDDPRGIFNIKMLSVFVPMMLVAAAAYLSGYIAIRKENTRIIVVFAVFSAVLIGAGLYIMIKSIQDLYRPNMIFKLSVVAITASTLMIFVRIITCAGCYLAYNNFGKGLKERANANVPEAMSAYANVPEARPLLRS